MAAWTDEELAAFGEADEIRITSLRRDGTTRPSVIIWIARLGNELFVRSAYGPDNGWYRRARASGRGTIRAGRLERDVAFKDASDVPPDDLHAAYHAKYDRYGPRIVGTVVSDEAAAATLRVVPR